jgi:chromosome segregation ATPase
METPAFKLKEIKSQKISDKTRRHYLINEVEELESNIEYAEMRIPELLKKLQSLKPTKKELEEGLQELFDTYL